MITLLHILIALGSVAYLAALLLRPTTFSFLPAYISAVGTIGTGIMLMIVQPSTIPHVCVSGSIYVVAAIAAIAFAKYRKAKYFTAS